VHQVHDWHRREQLAATVDLLQRWQPQFAGDLPAESACRLVDEVMQRAIELSGLVQALDASALQLLARLSPRQLAEMERQFTKSNRKFRDKYIEVSAQELLDTRVEAGLSRAQWIYGSLGRQQEVLQTLRELSQSQANPELARSALRALLSRMIDPQEPIERARVLSMRQQSCQVMAQLHASTTAAQRAKAQDNLRTSALDLKALMPPR
jgi:DNA-binding MarR family transcriptional regulator